VLQLLQEVASLSSEAAPRIAVPRLNRTIVLVGMMGAGKSSVGKRLAAFLQVPFTDSDTEIETAANMPVSEIFARFGEQYFRDGEQRVIARLIAGKPGVLATGGGAFVAEANRRAIREGAVSVWLKADVDTLFDRVKHKPGRPLLQGDDPKGVLEKLARQRASTYAEADVTVESTAGIPQDVMAARIIAAIRDAEARQGRRPPTLEDR
jgi:shikimate kinase